MKHIALLAIFQFIGVSVFCQSPTAPPAQFQPLPDKLPILPLFDLRSSGPSQSLFSTKLDDFSCFTPDPIRATTNTASEANKLFQASCTESQVFAITARNNLQSPPSQHTQRPRAKPIPIPTQWPNAKPEPIPTNWPNLKLLPIVPNTSGPSPTK